MCESFLFKLNFVLIPPVTRRKSVNILERSGKVQLILIPYCAADIRDTHGGYFQKLCRLCHSVCQYELLRSLAYRLFKYFSEIAAVEPAFFGNVLYTYIILKVMLNILYSLMDVEIPECASGRDLYLCN